MASPFSSWYAVTFVVAINLFIIASNASGVIPQIGVNPSDQSAIQYQNNLNDTVRSWTGAGSIFYVGDIVASIRYAFDVFTSVFFGLPKLILMFGWNLTGSAQTAYIAIATCVGGVWAAVWAWWFFDRIGGGHS